MATSIYRVIAVCNYEHVAYNRVGGFERGELHDGQLYHLGTRDPSGWVFNLDMIGSRQG